MEEKMTIETMKEWTKEALLVEFRYNGNIYKAVGGMDAVYWVFYKNEEEVGTVNGFENVFTYKFVEDKTMLDVFDEIEPTLGFY